MCLGTHVQVCAYVKRLEVDVRDFFEIFFYFVCMHVCICDVCRHAHVLATHVEVRGQLAELSSLPPLCGV